MVDYVAQQATTDFEDVIRTAVSLGGDCDTLTCIAGGMAEALYGVPAEIEAEGRKRLPEDMLAVLDRFAELKLAHGTAVFDGLGHEIQVMYNALYLIHFTVAEAKLKFC